MTASFSPSSLGKQLPMLRSIFEVPVVAGDGFPMYACRNCMSSAKSLCDKLSARIK